MTPRSRKPVIIGAMLGMSVESYPNNLLNFVHTEEIEGNDVDTDDTNIFMDTSMHKSKSESDLIGAVSAMPLLDPVKAKIMKLTNSQSEEALSVPFR